MRRSIASGIRAAETSYPEHEKLTAVREQSQAIGEFLDSAGYTLCTFREAGDNGEPMYVWAEREPWPGSKAAARKERGDTPEDIDFWNGYAEMNPAYESWGDSFWPVTETIERVLARYFEIDLDRLEAEKREMLASLRERAEEASK